MKRLLILSGKGGTGKTTLSAALIKLSGARAIADCDVDAPNLHLVIERSSVPESYDFYGGDKAQVDANKCIGCGKCEAHCRFDAIVMNHGKANIYEFACEGCGVCAFVCPVKAITLNKDLAGKRDLYMDDTVFSTATLKMGRGNSGKLVTEVKLAMLKAAPKCEISIVDGPPGIGCPVIASFSGMDLILVVAEPSDSGISDLMRLYKTAETFRIPLAVCVNKYDISLKHTDAIEEFCCEQGIPFVGKIPFDPSAVRAVNEGRSVADMACPSGEAIRAMYRTLLNLLNSIA